MQAIIFLASVIVCFLAAPQEAEKKSAERPTEPPMLLGVVDRAELGKEPYSKWFVSEYEAYDLDRAVLDSLKGLLADIDIEIFMGTWCSDSRREVPRFYKILDSLGFSDQRVRLVGLDRGKVSPGHEEKGMNIHHVPTFIFYLDQVEIGRIIETPVQSLEQDMKAIITGAPYIPNYYELE
ncbi:MAG: thiol reductase thioredoxin [Candidatus Neomarinimicrobiota bacterium]